MTIKTLKEIPEQKPFETREVALPAGVSVTLTELSGYDMALFYRWIVADKTRMDTMFYRLAAHALVVEEDLEDKYTWLRSLRDTEGVADILIAARELNGLSDEDGVEEEKKS